MEIQTPQEHEELKDIQWINDTCKRKKVHSNNEETEQTMKRKMNKYAIDTDILKWTLLNHAANLLPAKCLSSEFKFENLLGLGYYHREGRAQHNEGYVEGAQPDEDHYDLDGYTYWKFLSFLDDVDFQNEISGWVHQMTRTY